MNIKELQKLLDIPGSTIYFYETEGLLPPPIKEIKNRDYSDADVDQLRRVTVLRKLGITIADIKDLFEGKQDLQDVLEQQSAESDKPNGVLPILARLRADQVRINTLDGALYLRLIAESEASGQVFADISNDMHMNLSNLYDRLFKFTFGINRHDLHSKKAWITLPFHLVIRALVLQFITKSQSFWEVLLYLLAVPAVGFAILYPLHLLHKKHTRLAKITTYIIGWLGIAILSGIALLLVVLVLNAIFHFWF